MRYVPRYKRGDRVNHWIVALLFVCAALSGLAFFHPSLYFFSNLFGGGPWTRILHPFIGVLVFLGFCGLFARFRRANVMTESDRNWRRDIRVMVSGDKKNLPPAGRYNTGQKLVFWVFAGSLLVLLLTGLVFWRPWLADFFPILAIRIAVVLHSIAAVVLIIAAIIHIYAAIWVKGTVRAMTRGTVTEAWARQNHPRWNREVRGGP